MSSLALVGGDDTIVAVATAPGRSAVALLRVSGRDARAVTGRVLAHWSSEPRVATLVDVRDPDSGARLDQAIVTWYAAPRSYTGEELVELSVHGGTVVPALVLGALLAAGARQALPGEFTRRAVLNGKMDLLQAEAVGDLIDARSVAMHATAMAQLDGALSSRISALRTSVLELEALIAYDLDFPEEDDGPISRERIASAIGDTTTALKELLATARVGEMIRDGATVVLAGAPNVGKSSLFNALIGSARAIVTDVPGTTRDAIEALVDLDRWPVRLVDTAGLRDTQDIVERLGVEVSEQWLARAEIVLACGDTPILIAAAIGAARRATAAPVIAVRTKADLAATDEIVANSDYVDIADHELVSDRYQFTAVSAMTGAGIGELSRLISQLLSARAGSRQHADAPLLTRERHRRAIATALSEVEAFGAAWSVGAVPAIVAASHLRAAAGALEELIGTIDVETILDRVFSAFCVGK